MTTIKLVNRFCCSFFGNGLSHILFLPQTASVVEVFSPDAHLLDYRLFADARGIAYNGIISNRGILESNLAYEMGPFGNPNGTINSLDIDLILTLVKSRFKE